MKPILYAPDETNFETQGLGVLSDAISCYVSEERNGSYELEMKYPFDGIHFSEIQHSSILKVKPYDNAGLQLFRVYKITSPMNKQCTVYAEHISYQLNFIPLMPFTAYDIQSTLYGITTHMTEQCPFTFWTDIQSAAVYEQMEPEVVRARLGGQEGSILDVYGGEYEWDNYTVKLHQQRGTDRDVTLRYGKNITDISQEESIANTYTGVTPFWIGDVIDENAKARLLQKKADLEGSISDLENQINAQTNVVAQKKAAWESAKAQYGSGSAQAKKKKKAYQNQKEILNNLKKAKENAQTQLEEVESELDSIEGTKTEVCVTLPEQTLYAAESDNFPFQRVRTLDLSDKFQEQPTVAELRDMAQAWMDASNFGEPAINLKVSFVALWDTEEYKSIAPLERVQLCDTVVVEFERLGIRVAAKVTAYKYDVLLERYNSITLGDAKKTLASSMSENHQLIVDVVEQIPKPSDMQAEIDRATKLINGGYGGYVVFVSNASGQPEEILIMDDPDISDATNVIRMNKNGIGFSTSGYEGPYTTAWTIDGHFVADFITTGTLTASLIKAGILGDVAGKNYWNMVTGEFKLTAASTSVGSSSLSSYVDGRVDSEVGSYDGITLQNGALYINASYIDSGTLSGDRITGGEIVGTSIKSPNVYTTVERYWRLDGHGLWMVFKNNGTDTTGFHIDIGGWDAGKPDFTTIRTAYGDLDIEAAAAVRSDTIKGTTVATPVGNIVIGNAGKLGLSGSTRLIKHDIEPLTEADLDPHKLYSLRVVQFKYNEDVSDPEDRYYLQNVPGFIAEEVDEVYPVAAMYLNGRAHDWNYRYIVPPMLKLIQEQHAEIENLKSEMAEMKAQMQKILTKIGE